MKVFRYELSGSEGASYITRYISMPHGARVVHFGQQGGELMVWAIVDADTVVEQTRRFQVVGTGHEFPEGANYLGTTFQGPFVWHLFETLEVV